MAEGGIKKSGELEEENPIEEDDHTSLFQDLSEKFKEFLNINSNCKDGKREKVVESLDLDGIIGYIKSGKCTNIIIMAGAGISTSAGLPDFRSPGSGLYDNLASYNLPDPIAIFEIQYFKKNPEPFFVLAKKLFPIQFNPTLCHYFIKLLHDKGLLLRHYTQNIDSLERDAGLPADKIVEAHGTFRTGHCLKCKTEYTQDWMKAKIFETTIPKCDKPGCVGIVKPDIVFFGEDLPLHFYDFVRKDFKKCDLLMIMGTSLVVQPFASVVERAKKDTPRLYINLENKTEAGFRFGKETNYRDIFWQGSCDDGCLLMAKNLGWEEDLKVLISGKKKEHSKEDQKPETVQQVA